MRGKEDNVTHASAAIIGLALRDIETTGTVSDRNVQALNDVRTALRSLCPDCAAKDKDG